MYCSASKDKKSGEEGDDVDDGSPTEKDSVGEGTEASGQPAMGKAEAGKDPAAEGENGADGNDTGELEEKGIESKKAGGKSGETTVKEAGKGGGILSKSRGGEGEPEKLKPAKKKKSVKIIVEDEKEESSAASRAEDQDSSVANRQVDVATAVGKLGLSSEDVDALMGLLAGRPVNSLLKEINTLKKKVANPWHIDAKDVSLTKKLGAGACGEVWKGSYMGQDVAVKILNAKVTNQLTKDFDAELAMLREFRRYLILSRVSATSSLFLFLARYPLYMLYAIYIFSKANATISLYIFLIQSVHCDLFRCLQATSPLPRHGVLRSRLSLECA